MRRARRAAVTFSMARRERSLSRRRLEIARSTLVQEVFWVRMAPTMTSKRERPGHQPCWPGTARSVAEYPFRTGRVSGKGREYGVFTARKTETFSVGRCLPRTNFDTTFGKGRLANLNFAR